MDVKYFNIKKPRHNRAMEKAKRRTEAILRAAEARRRPGKERKIKIVPEFERYTRMIGNDSITDGLSIIWQILPAFHELRTSAELSLEHLPPKEKEMLAASLKRIKELEFSQQNKEN